MSTERSAAPLRIWFADNPEGVKYPTPYIRSVLPPFVLDQNNPDLVVYQSFGAAHRAYDCARLFLTGENLRPDFNRCDYAIGFDYLDFGDRHLRVPLWVFYSEARRRVAKRLPVTADDLKGREFCLNVVSNGGYVDPLRDGFFHALNAERPVASMGRHLRNDERLAEAEAKRVKFPKLSFENQFLFTIAFENASSAGYVTEKIFEAFALRSIPIYWGDPLVAREFNPAAFVNRMDFPDDESCISYVLDLAQDEARMVEMLNAPIYAEGISPEAYDEKLRAFFAAIFTQPRGALRRRSRYGAAARVEVENTARYQGLRGRIIRYLERRG